MGIIFSNFFFKQGKSGFKELMGIFNLDRKGYLLSVRLRAKIHFKPEMILILYLTRVLSCEQVVVISSVVKL